MRNRRWMTEDEIDRERHYAEEYEKMMKCNERDARQLKIWQIAVFAVSILFVWFVANHFYKRNQDHDIWRCYTTDTDISDDVLNVYLLERGDSVQRKWEVLRLASRSLQGRAQSIHFITCSVHK